MAEFLESLSDDADTMYDLVSDPYRTTRQIPKELEYYASEDRNYYDYTYDTRVNNVRDGRLVLNPDRSPYAEEIIRSAYSNIGTGNRRLEKSLPWPENESGRPVENGRWLEAAFRGKDIPGKLFPQNEDYIEVGRDVLSGGDIIIPKDKSESKIVTAVFDDKIEVVVGAGRDASHTEFISKDEINDTFSTAFRYFPDTSK